MAGAKAEWHTAEHHRPRAPHGAGLRSFGAGICIDVQCKDPSHYMDVEGLLRTGDVPKALKKRYCITGTCRHAYCKGLRDGAERGFVQGVGYAVAEVVRSHDQPTIAADVASAAGYTVREYMVAGVDEYDLKTLRKVRRDHGQFPRSTR